MNVARGSMPYNEHNQGVQHMGQRDFEIRQLASTGKSNELMPLLQEALADPNTEGAAHLETASLKYQTHQFFLQTKGDISAIYGDVPDLAVESDPVPALDKYEQSITDYLGMYRDDWRAIVGADLSPQEARQDALGKLVAAASDWNVRGVKSAPVQAQLAVVANKKWDNAKLREVISENWAGGVTEGLWTIVNDVGREAKTRLAEGQSAQEVGEWYGPVVEHLFEDVLQVTDRVISETQPDLGQQEAS